jgi:multidrug efflux pump subunit AcrA (membrane-fusion protein)
MAGPRTPLLTIATRGHLVVKAAVADRYAPQVLVGTLVTVTGPTLPKPLPLTVTRVYQSADPKTRLMPFEAALPPGIQLAVGSLVQVRIELEKAVGVPVAPVDALLSRPGGKRVAFVVEQEKAVLRPVEVGLEAEGKAEIRQGLRVGEQLVVGGQEMLRDQMPVKVGGKGDTGAKSGKAGQAGSAAGSPQPAGQAAPAGESR